MKKILFAALGLGLVGVSSEVNAQGNSFFRSYSNTRMNSNDRAATRSISRRKKESAVGDAEARPPTPGDTVEKRPRP
jgi:hypothetical protein